MPLQGFEVERDLAIMHTDGQLCETTVQLAESDTFEKVVDLFVKHLKETDSPILDEIGSPKGSDKDIRTLVALLRLLATKPLEEAAPLLSGGQAYAQRVEELNRFAQELYNFWRNYNRFLICHSESGPDRFDRRPYRTFNATAERLNHLVRGLYRDVCENLTGEHPRVYRQVAAGCHVGLIAVPIGAKMPEPYRTQLGPIPIIRQVLIHPPLILDPPMNKRQGRFQKIDRNPLASMVLDPSKYLCYPAQVGPMVAFVYFHQHVIGLGTSLANLFELATDAQVAAGPDAVYVFGAPPGALLDFGDFPTVFFDDAESGLLVGAVPLENRFAYFGYLKKMILTLHNAWVMKRGRMPFHGAMSHIVLRGGNAATLLMLGDTATGKSETLEAFRSVGEKHIREIRIIADDMGSLEVDPDGRVIGYGTETGAFVRLDDLQQGYAFGQIDRTILMSPQKTNARVVLPVTTIEEALRGYPIDLLLYANNYEQVEEDHPIIESFESADEALRVFREGKAMSKGTTTSKGIVHNYFANIFGPPQYREIHDQLAERVFAAAYDGGVYIGKVRTRLGIPGFETTGPEEAARALLDLVARRRGAATSVAKG